MKITSTSEFVLETTVLKDAFASIGKGTATQLLKKGLLLRFKKEIPQAIEVTEKALAQFTKQKNVLGQAFCAIELAWLYGVQHELSTSQDYFEKSELLIKAEQSPAMVEAQTRLLHYKGLLLYQQGDYGQAMKYFKQALLDCEADGLESAKIYDSLGVHYERTGDFHRAVRYLRHSLYIKRQYEDVLYEEAITCQILGRLYLIYEEFELALVHLERSLEISQILKDEKRKAAIKVELIRLYLRCGRENEARALIYDARHECELRHFHVQLAFTHFYEAYLHYQQEDFEEARKIIERKVLPTFQRNKYKKGLATAKRLMAWILMAVSPEESHTALEYMGEAILLFRKENQIEEVAKTHFELGKLYCLLSNPELALTSFLDALKLAEENGLFYLTPYIEDEIQQTNEAKWLDIVNKRTRHERVFEKQESLVHLLDEFFNNDQGSSSAITKASSSAMTTENNKSLAYLLTMLRISEAIAGVRDINDLLKRVALETEKALNAEKCSVFLYEAETNSLWARTDEDQTNNHYQALDTISGYVVKTGQSLNITDAKEDPRFKSHSHQCCHSDAHQHIEIQTMLCIPMKNRKDQMLGVIQVINKKEDVFHRSDEELLSAIAASAGVALENAELYSELKMTFESFIKTLSTTIDARDPITAGHSERVTEFALLIGDEMLLSEDEMEALKYAGLLHDIGKIGVREEVLMKQGRLTIKEYEHIQYHVVLTDQILKNIRFEKHLSGVPEIASSHHEKMDGTGYFRGTKGDEIPLGGRILAAADVLDAITSRRQYRSRMPFDRVIRILREESGKHFDGQVIDAFFRVSLRSLAKIFCMDSYILETTKHDVEKLFLKIPAELTLQAYIQMLDFGNLSVEQEATQDAFEKIYNLTAISDLD